MLRIIVLLFAVLVVEAAVEAEAACVGECPSRSQVLLQVAKEKTQTLGITSGRLKRRTFG